MTPKLETNRLTLRSFIKDDFCAVHSWASNPLNLRYMLWGPNTDEDTKKFIENTKPGKDFAVVLKETGAVIGSCGIYPNAANDTAEVGWILHIDYWKRGFGTELAQELLRYGFENLKLRRISSESAAGNYGSRRVMELNGMRQEAVYIKSRWGRIDKDWIDGVGYAILSEEWDTQKEIMYYNSLPVKFENFIDFPKLTDGEIRLVCTAQKPAIPEKKYVPAYEFTVFKDDEKIGEINIRIGYKGFGPNLGSLYYGGQVGYGIDEIYRGNGYAVKACRLIKAVAKAHGMSKLIITNEINNHASKRVCEKLGARFIRTAPLPEWTNLYKEGERFVNIFEWNTGK